MHNIRSSNKGKLFKIGASQPKTTIKTVFILAIVIDAKVAKVIASFLASRAMNIWKRNTFFDHSFSRSSDSEFF